MAAEQIHRKNTNKNEIIEEDKEKIMKHLGYPLSPTLIQGRDRPLIFESMTTNARSYLISRVTETNILVYYNPGSSFFNADAAMAGRPQRRGVTNAGSNGNTALAGVRVAIEYQNTEMVISKLKANKDLINSFGDDGLTPLSYAASKGFAVIVSSILINFPNSWSSCNKDKSLPIHKACLGGHIEVLKEFHLHSKARKSFGEVTRHSQNVMHLAAKHPGNGLKDVVSYLSTIEEGRKLIKKRDENDRTPLELAIITGNAEVATLIRKIRC